MLEASISVGGVSSKELDGEKDDFVDVFDASSTCSDVDANLRLLEGEGETKAVTSCRLPAAVSNRIKREALFFILFCWLS